MTSNGTRCAAECDRAPARAVRLLMRAALWIPISAFAGNAEYNACVTRECDKPHASITGCAVWCEYLRNQRPGEQGASARQYGAFFLESRNQRFGYSSGFSSREAAEKRARDGCIQNGGTAADCKLVAWFFNQCAALALSAEQNPDENRWAWAIDDYKSKAISKALTVCRNDGGTKCEVRVATCSG